MSFTEVFGGQNIFPSELTLLELAMTADVELSWPVEQALAGDSVFADIIEVTADAGLSITMPDARNAGPGQATLINNIGVNTFSVLDNLGNNIGSVASGEVWQFYLSDNTTQAGTWRTFEFGAGASSAVAAALAGAGLKAITTTLNVKITPTLTASTPVTLVDGDRATALVWTGGVGDLNLPDPAVVGADWFVYIRNAGTGDLTVTPPSGLINGAASLDFSADDSAVVLTDGTDFYTFGLQTMADGVFDFVSINVAGTGDYTLSGSELNRIGYRFTGVLTGNRVIIVPASIQEYWVDNQTTGAFTLTVKTSAGTGVEVPQGLSRILYCDGSNVEYANSIEIPLPVTEGGTGLITVAQGDLLYASATDVLSSLAKDATATRYLSNTGASNSPAWAQVNLTDGVTGNLPYANLAQGPGLSVLGVAGAVPADNADIIATAANQVFRNNQFNTGIGWGPIRLDDNTNAVSNVLDETNGGTGLATYAQGDMLYASATDTLSALAKATTGLQALFNTGTTNNPAWMLPRFTAGTAVNADTTFALTDGWTIIPHTEATTARAWTVPPNGTVAFPVGTMIGIDNRAGSGAITVTAGTGVTIDGHGSTVTAAAGPVIPPGYKAILWKMDTDVWALMTDAPKTTGVGAVYSGYVDAAATAEQVPSGWSVTNTGTGLYTVTHNLGLSGANDLSIMLTLIRALADDTFINVIAPGVNSFTLGINDSGGGATDSAFFFLCSRNL